MIKLTLPYPPSINHYWRRTGTRFYICERGIQYRKDTRKAVVMTLGFDFESIQTPISLLVNVFPPDKRRRDIDNIAKCLMDSLEYAKVIGDDYQVNELHLFRCSPILSGKLEIEIIPL